MLIKHAFQIFGQTIWNVSTFFITHCSASYYTVCLLSARGLENKPLTTLNIGTILQDMLVDFQHVLHHQTSLSNSCWQNFQQEEAQSPISWPEGFSVSIPPNALLPRDLSAQGKLSEAISHLRVSSKGHKPCSSLSSASQ